MQMLYAAEDYVAICFECSDLLLRCIEGAASKSLLIPAVHLTLTWAAGRVMNHHSACSLRLPV